MDPRNPQRNNGPGEIETSRFHASPDTVYNTIGDQSVLVHTRTNRIFELNRTGARFWELLCEGRNLGEIQQIMLREFDVAEADLRHEVEALLATLQNEDLVVRIS